VAAKKAPKVKSEKSSSAVKADKGPYKAHLRSLVRFSVNKFAGEDAKVRRTLNAAVREVNCYPDLCEALRTAGYNDEQLGEMLVEFFDKA
jgi:hypothetical protein